jgi:hypothetical protein
MFRRIFDPKQYPPSFGDYGRSDIDSLLSFSGYEGDFNKTKDAWTHMRHLFADVKDDENETAVFKILKKNISSSENWGVSFLARFISTIPSTSVCNERGFSALRIIKNYLRTTTTDDHLCWILFIYLNINCSVPPNILSLIANTYLDDERRTGNPKEIKSPNDNTVFLFENFGSYYKQREEVKTVRRVESIKEEVNEIVNNNNITTPQPKRKIQQSLNDYYSSLSSKRKEKKNETKIIYQKKFKEISKKKKNIIKKKFEDDD